MNISEKLTYYLLRFMSWKTHLFPRYLTIKFGRFLGYIIWLFFSIRKEVAFNNISIAFPDKSEKVRKEILKKTYLHFGVVLMDFLRMPYMTEKQINELVVLDEDSIRLLNKHKKGVIVTAHFGNWEFLQPMVSFQGFPFGVVAQRQKNKGANKYFTWAREKTGIEIIYKREPVRKMLSALKIGFLALASDQYGGKYGAKIKFFGKPTRMPKGAASFNLKIGSPILNGYCILSNDYSYKLSLKEVIIDNKIDEKNSVEYICQLLSDMLENEVVKHPEQYFWFHRKWRIK
jgi:Kdo2-lipid IVA lauroyltransferase/acyltransferase